MPIEAMPIPLPITETVFPLYFPVKPSMFLTLLKHLTSVRKFSAINCALKGSPGIKTLGAISPIFAEICGVGMFDIIKTRPIKNWLFYSAFSHHLLLKYMFLINKYKLFLKNFTVLE